MARFEITRRDLRDARWAEAPDPAPAEGQVRVAIDAFALTANNVTYAAFGEAMQYWRFFPTGDERTGCLPVWGFGVVEESRCAGVEPGERIYGYWPIADRVRLEPKRIDAAGFVDGAAHRRELHPIYNRYRFCRADPVWRADREAEQAVLEPLFTTSFLIDDFLADNGFFGARQVLFASASSKTAYATAFCLARRAAAGVTVAGLTSPGNRAFTASLGCYARVAAYDEIATLDPSVPTAYVDMSGSAKTRAAVHRHFGDNVVYDCAVGGTHWDEVVVSGGERLPGARPTLFFAPAQGAKRFADWGAAGFAQRVGEASAAFVARASDPAAPWLRIVEGRGREAIAAAYAAFVDGRVDPRDGHFLHLA